ncbi:XdhC family protein [Nocardia sp. NBC_00565]|uniref:XdhC family protein n=1 Tax=Nocardia sp. NBC_00565 TaxID=2975993 RepID=UPI002E80A6D5|nr:XdhC family protein [Nocardia sp. NBC_00565]WUC00712.1 XdhC family protein [Nocardia sp. NBC_00565]
MRTILEQLVLLAGRGPVALARIVDATGPGPRELGAAMVVTDSAVLGSLSGGCVEAAVVESAREVLVSGHAVSDRFGYAEADGFAVGLTCGGEIEVFVERVDSTRLPLLVTLRAAIDAGAPVSLATALDAAPDWKLLRPGDSEPWRGVDRDAQALLTAGRSGLVGSDECEAVHGPRPRVFVQTFAAPARMILAGANDFVRALARTGRQLGYRITVVDARETFATPARFPSAHEVVVDWPHRYLTAEHAAGRIDHRTVVCVLTHDTKFDVPMIVAALAIEEIAFVGALGSRRTHHERTDRLRAAGVSDDQLSHLKSPLGLDLNAHTPDETAISIAAQILAERGGGSARPLARTDGPIHH